MSTDQIVFEEKNEQFGFTQLPNVVLTSTVLNPTEVRIYAILRRYASMPNGAMPSVPTICAEANISKTTYSRAIKTFVRSAQNPQPKIPLITAIHRANQTNLFKIHKIKDVLVEKLKPTIAMEESDREQLKAKHKSKKSKKGRFQNETPIENPREFQNDTPRVGFKMKLRSVSNRNTNNIELSNIDNNKEQEQKDVVVFLKKEIKNTFEKTVTNGTAKQMITTFQAHGKTIDEGLSLLTEINQEYSSAFGHAPTIKEMQSLLVALLENNREFSEILKGTIAYFQRKNQSIYNPVGSLLNAIEKGFVLQQEDKEAAAQRGSVEAAKKIEATKKLLEMYQ